MKIVGTVFLVLIAVAAANICAAQQSQKHDPPSQSTQQSVWTPRAVEDLRQKASSKTEFTLDHSMLVFASKLDSDDEDLRRVIAGVNGVSVHSYRFSGPGMYDLAALGSVKDEYRAAGWKQVMNKEKDGGREVTNAWMRLENNAISNVAVLQARATEVDFVVVSGSISPVDLSHLSGHFGIPKIEGGVVVPNTSRRP
ncbi:MAG: DUF4252 domain-containing protein [Terriglobales bacterium]